jgi:hypothetical protein
MNDGTRWFVETRVPGIEFDTDSLVTTKSADELSVLRAWLKDRGHPPLRRVCTRVLFSLWAHDAAILAEFDRTFPSTAFDVATSRPIDSMPESVHVFYRIDPRSSSYRSLNDLPPLTHLELVRVPKRARRKRRG